MAADKTRNRLARLEAAHGVTNGQYIFASLGEIYEHIELADRHQRCAKAGECVRGEGLDPKTLQVLQGLDHFYRRPRSPE